MSAMKLLLLAAAMLASIHYGQAAHKKFMAKRLAGRKNNLASLIAQLDLDASTHFKLGDNARTSKGNRRQKLEQMFHDLKVIGAAADVEVTNNGVFRGIFSGHVAFNLEHDISDTSACNREESELLEKAQQELEQSQGLTIPSTVTPRNVKSQKVVYYDEDEGTSCLAYQLEFFLALHPNPSRPFFIIDACTLDVIKSTDKIHQMTLARRSKRQSGNETCDTTPTPTTGAPIPFTLPPGTACPTELPGRGIGGNEKIGAIYYGNDPYCLHAQVQNNGATCIMDNKYARVIDLQGDVETRDRGTVEFRCIEGYSDAINGAYGVANDAFYYGDSTGRVYEDWYGIDTILGFQPILRIHYSQDYCNAFWDGSQMTFGDGCSAFFPLVTQDVVAHELGHGVTDRYSDLFYGGQSGGINEAFSDMSGEVAELYSRGSNDWLIGADMVKAEGALRYFETPSLDGYSIDSALDYTRGLNVHYSSGVFNRAYWKLVNEENLPLRRTYEVFLLANQVLWTVFTNYDRGACGAMQAAYDLGYNVTKFKNAFKGVDIDLSDCDIRPFIQTMEDGDVREEVLVSTIRNPVFEINVPENSTVTVNAFTDTDNALTISTTSDAEGFEVTETGSGSLRFAFSPENRFFKVSSGSDEDIEVEITLKVIEE